jgi:hypothetical protein
MAHRVGSLRRTESVAIEGIADSLAARRSDANDPKPTLPEEPRSRCHKNPVKNFALHRIAAPIFEKPVTALRTRDLWASAKFVSGADWWFFSANEDES